MTDTMRTVSSFLACMATENLISHKAESKREKLVIQGEAEREDGHGRPSCRSRSISAACQRQRRIAHTLRVAALTVSWQVIDNEPRVTQPPKPRAGRDRLPPPHPVRRSENPFHRC